MAVRLAKCAECRNDGYARGHQVGLREGEEQGYDRGYADCTHEGDAREVLPEVRAVLVEAHRNAGHGGRWEACADVVCSELERFIHFETRPATTARSVS